MRASRSSEPSITPGASPGRSTAWPTRPTTRATWRGRGRCTRRACASAGWSAIARESPCRSTAWRCCAVWPGSSKLARELANEALALRRDLGDRRGIGGSLLTLASLALWGGDLDQAQHLARESLGIRSSSGRSARHRVLPGGTRRGGIRARAARTGRPAARGRRPPSERRSTRPRRRWSGSVTSGCWRPSASTGARAVGEVAGIEAVVAEELKATRHAAGLPDPAIKDRDAGTWSKGSG